MECQAFFGCPLGKDARLRLPGFLWERLGAVVSFEAKPWVLVAQKLRSPGRNANCGAMQIGGRRLILGRVRLPKRSQKVLGQVSLVIGRKRGQHGDDGRMPVGGGFEQSRLLFVIFPIGLCARCQQALHDVDEPGSRRFDQRGGVLGPHRVYVCTFSEGVLEQANVTSGDGIEKRHRSERYRKGATANSQPLVNNA
jgi:hypothetical protein